MIKILSFGSCLSRYTANSFLKLVPGELMGSVFHNRSDAFLANYVDNQWQLPDYNKLVGALDFKENEKDSAIQILENQYPFQIGLHNLPELKLPLLERLVETELDVIILDNYMDVRPFLMRPLDKPDERVFFHNKFLNKSAPQLELVRELIPIAQSVQNWYRILNWLRHKQPKAFFVFIQFPYNLYEDIERARRCQEFEALFTPSVAVDRVLNIPPLYIMPEFRNRDPQHYKMPQYAFYSGLIYQYLSANPCCPLFKEPSIVYYDQQMTLLASNSLPEDPPKK